MTLLKRAMAISLLLVDCHQVHTQSFIQTITLYLWYYKNSEL